MTEFCNKISSFEVRDDDNEDSITERCEEVFLDKSRPLGLGLVQTLSFNNDALKFGIYFIIGSFYR